MVTGHKLTHTVTPKNIAADFIASAPITSMIAITGIKKNTKASMKVAKPIDSSKARFLSAAIW